MVRAMPKDDGLKEPVRKFEDTFSADQLIFEKFLKNKQTKNCN